jgi:hypothetical protein
MITTRDPCWPTTTTGTVLRKWRRTKNPEKKNPLHQKGWGTHEYREA